jgi:hypothetical protein
MECGQDLRSLHEDPIVIKPVSACGSVGFSRSSTGSEIAHETIPSYRDAGDRLDYPGC